MYTFKEKNVKCATQISGLLLLCTSLKHMSSDFFTSKSTTTFSDESIVFHFEF